MRGCPSALADVQPLAILLRHDAAGAAQACTYVRSQLRWGTVPVITVTSEPGDLAFAELFSWGGDDLVALDSPQPLVRRLRVLAAGPGAAKGGPAPGAGTRDGSADRRAVIAGTDATWRTLVGRALYNGGFSVWFAGAGDGVTEECARDNTSVVVAADDLAPDGAVAALTEARARGSNGAWVVVAPPKRMAAAYAAVKGLGRVSVADGFAPPENVLFLVNELLAPRGVDKRASPRLLYGTTVAFRPAGRESDEYGYAYNVSAGGLYVRTTAPPDPGQEVWLEMWAPRADRRVRLAGRTAWRRPFGPIGGATVPAGFGVQLTDGLSGDLERWRHGHELLVARLLGTAATT